MVVVVFIDQSAPDINKLEVRYQLAFSASATIDNPQRSDEVCVC